jgi:serine/threonine protein kinase
VIHVGIDENHKEFREFSQDIKEYFSKSDEVITAKRNIIKIIEQYGKKVVVKSFKIPNFINQFAYRFIRDSKAKRSFLNAKELIKLGINTPVPISYIEFFSPLLKESFYICEYFDYDFEIRDVLKDENFKNRDEILKAFVAFSYSLHQKGIYHIDYSPGNVLIKIKDGVYHFSIVDVNRMKFIVFDDKLRFKNLSRFSASKKDTTTIAKEYAKVANIDEEFALRQLFFYHDKHQQYLENKRKLKKVKSS